jgi:hypothetical protein
VGNLSGKGHLTQVLKDEWQFSMKKIGRECLIPRHGGTRTNMFRNGAWSKAVLLGDKK